MSGVVWNYAVLVGGEKEGAIKEFIRQPSICQCYACRSNERAIYLLRDGVRLGMMRNDSAVVEDMLYQVCLYGGAGVLFSIVSDDDLEVASVVSEDGCKCAWYYVNDFR